MRLSVVINNPSPGLLLTVFGISDHLERLIKIITKFGWCIYTGNICIYIYIYVTYTLIKLKWHLTRSKRFQKGHFEPFRNFLVPRFVLNVIRNLLVVWPHMSGISIPNLLMTELTLLNWLPEELSKVWILEIFSRKGLC